VSSSEKAERARVRAKAWYHANKDRHKETRLKWRAAHPDEYKRREKARTKRRTADRNADPEKRATYLKLMRERAAIYLEKIREDPEKVAHLRNRMQRWRDANREAVNRRQSERSRAKRAAMTPGQRRILNASSHYGISPEAIVLLGLAQDRSCAICRRKAYLVVDHNHATDSVRGLLCTACNHGLGSFRDSPGLLIAAAEYLRRPTLVQAAERATA
jgi:hypothetical protein